MRFEWDKEKNRLNIIKHKISFEEAETVFDDINAVYIYDELHSIDEDRYNVIGMADTINHEITVCHCYRENDDIIRIISARKATQNEEEIYKGRIVT